MEDKNVIEGPSLERSIYTSAGEFLFSMLKMHDDKLLQIDATTGEEVTAKALLSRAIHLVKWLKAKNVNVGDCIAICTANCLEFSIVTVATLISGITLAPLNPDYTTGELQHALNLSKPKIIFCSCKTISNVRTDKQSYPFANNIILIGKNTDVADKNFIMFNDIMQGISSDMSFDTFVPDSSNPEESVALILCSSGTTGMPKGVMTTHYNITAYIEIISQIMQDHVQVNNGSYGKTMAGVCPFFHGMGFFLMLLSMVGGLTLVVYSKFEPRGFLESIQKYKITTVIVPPPILLFLTKHPLVKEYDLSSIDTVRSGAAPMGRSVEDEVKKQFKVDHVSQTYGMTETTLAVLMTQGGTCKLGSVGRVVPGMKCKVIDEKGNTLGPNREGELCFKGPLIMKGYVNDPISTAKILDINNWLYTGDIGYYDEEGYFYVVDRIKELIKYKGFQVAPAELEAILQGHPAVADVAVVGLEDERVGELPLAYVVKKPNVKVTEGELEKYVAEKVSSAKRLRGGVYFIEKIPRNPTGKILRRVLRQYAKDCKSKL